MNDFRYDVFIAYHGDDKTGTQGIASEIYKFINNAKVQEHIVKAYMNKESAPYGNFSDTPRIVASTPLFLLVVNKNIALDANGQIAEETDDGQRKFLYEEIKAFRTSLSYRSLPNGAAAKLLCCGNWKDKDVNRLEPLFNGSPAFYYKDENVKEQILEWISKYAFNHEKFSCNTLQSKETSDAEDIDWTVDRAKTWHKMKPPSRPADSELEIYKEFFDQVKKDRCYARNPKALILGSTVEFRRLAYEKGFETTVVDYSEEYYNEISKQELLNENDIKNAENYVKCDWCKMAEKLSSSKFDIIIGDLAIGNIPPEKIPTFFQNVKLLLADRGYFLGKSIYKYSDYSINANQISELLKEMSERSDINSENIYSHIMYPLSVYAIDTEWQNAEKYNNNAYKIKFEDIYSVVDKTITDKKQREKFAIYLNETTKFDKKMPKDFFIYGYHFLLEQLNSHDLYLDDVIYSTEEFKNDFPLIIVRKGKEPQTIIKSIDAFLGDTGNLSPEVIKTWKNYVSSIYFLSNIEGHVTGNELKQHIVNLLNNANITVREEDLNYFFSSIDTQNLEAETNQLAADTQLSDNEEIKKEAQLNYICGILLSIANSVNTISGKNSEIGNHLINLTLRTLFKHKNKCGQIWRPTKSPWVSARICICLFPLYEVWKKEKKNSDSVKEYIAKLQEVVGLLAGQCDKKRLFWESEMGSHFDTSALCIETLYLYSKYIENLDTIINTILDKYVRGERIKETFIKYPIFDSLVKQVCNGDTINGKPARKKLCGRIAWYSILYKICKERGSNDEELLKMSEYIASKLTRFWRIFLEKSNDIINATTKEEKSLVPQILFCLKRTGLFDLNR